MAVSVSAQVLISPVGVTESGLGTYDSTTPLTNMINQSGIKTPFTNGVTVFDSYFTPDDKFSRNVDNTKWQSLVSFDLPLVGNLDFDLGDTYLISKLAIWNVSVKDTEISIAGDQAGLDTVSPVGTFTLTQNLFSLSMRADLITLPTATPGRFLRLHVLSEYKFSPGDNFAYATIGEVAVGGAKPPVEAYINILYATNGDVTLTFLGVLQSATDLESEFKNIPGNPQGNYTIPSSNLVARQFFRAAGN